MDEVAAAAVTEGPRGDPGAGHLSGAVRAPRRSFAPIAVAAVLGLLVLSLIMGVVGRGSRTAGPAPPSGRCRAA